MKVLNEKEKRRKKKKLMKDIENRRIIVVEEEVLVEIDVEENVEDENGKVVGKVGKVRKEIDIIKRKEVDEEIMEVNIEEGDVEKVMERMKRRNILVVINKGGGLKKRIEERYKEMKVLKKKIKK